MKLHHCFALVVLSFGLSAGAQDYPNMVGVWTGNVRTVSSGGGVSSQVARGGIVIADVEMTVTIDHQDEETFIGKSRNSGMSKDDRSVSVWGAIRSNGKEALWVGGGGGRGDLWLRDENEFEFCLTNHQDTAMSAYCGVLNRKVAQ